jgi:hypothetical protein
MRPSDEAWLVLAAGVIVWDAAAPDGEMLSEAADRWMVSRPWLTRIIVAAFALHLCNGVPARLDPVHGAFLLARSLRRRVR